MSKFNEKDLELASQAESTDEIFKNYVLIYKIIKKYDENAEIFLRKKNSFNLVKQDFYDFVKVIQKTFGVGSVKIGYYIYKETYNNKNSCYCCCESKKYPVKTIIEKYKKLLTKKEIKEARACPQAIIDVMFTISKYCVVLETLYHIINIDSCHNDDERTFKFKIFGEDFIFFYVFENNILERVYYSSMHKDPIIIDHPSECYD